MPDPKADVQNIQPQVQRRLGRVMIRIQQYERLLKALLIDSDVEGTPESAAVHRQKRTEKFKSLTLGTLVKEMTGSLMRTATPAADADADPPKEVPYFRFRFGLTFAEERLVRVEEDLRQLVTLRNDLVHHLIDHFDIFSVAGCEAALAHLEQSYQTVDAALIQLTEWTQGSAKVREHAVAFMTSPEFLEHLLAGPQAPTKKSRKRRR